MRNENEVKMLENLRGEKKYFIIESMVYKEHVKDLKYKKHVKDLKRKKN